MPFLFVILFLKKGILNMYTPEALLDAVIDGAVPNEKEILLERVEKR